MWADSHFKCNMSWVLILDEYAFVTARLKAEIYLQIHNRLIEELFVSTVGSVRHLWMGRSAHAKQRKESLKEGI